MATHLQHIGPRPSARGVLMRGIVRAALARSKAVPFERGRAQIGSLAAGSYLVAMKAPAALPALAGPPHDERSCMALVVHGGTNAHLLMLDKPMPSAAIFPAQGGNAALPAALRLAALPWTLGEILCGMRSRYADDCSDTFGLGRLRQLLPDECPAGAASGQDWPVCFVRMFAMGIGRATPDSSLMRVAPAFAARMPDKSATARIGVHVHLYYHDLWTEMAGALAAMAPLERLWITTCAESAPLFASIRAAFPQAEIRVVANRGRDVAPFLELLRGGAFDGLDYVCKLHGKKSSGPGDAESYLGRAWRRQCLFELAGSAAQVGRILALFERDPAIGIVGPAALRLPNAHVNAAHALGKNDGMVDQVLERCGHRGERPPVDFHAGNMFWCRPAALRRLRSLDVAPTDFPPEPIAGDGSLAHALERAVPMLSRLSGYRVADAPEHA